MKINFIYFSLAAAASGGEGMRPWIRLVALAAGLLPATARAADLIEPWDPGFTNLEFHLAGGDAGGGDLSCLAGFGLSDGISLGAAALVADGRALELALIAFVTRSVSPRQEVDAFLEISHARAGPDEDDIPSSRWTGGIEWSRSGDIATPYVRMAVHEDAAESTISLSAGGMLPAGRRMELHLEATAEHGAAGWEARRVATGPNLRLPGGMEVLPEVSVTWGSGRHGATFAFSLGLVMDPRRLR